MIEHARECACAFATEERLGEQRTSPMTRKWIECKRTIPVDVNPTSMSIDRSDPDECSVDANMLRAGKVNRTGF